jgi:hypothetical protein
MNGTTSAVPKLTLHRVVRVTMTDNTLSVDLDAGRTIAVPYGWYARLTHGTQAERTNVQISGAGMACIGLTSMKISAWKDCCWASSIPRTRHRSSNGCSGPTQAHPRDCLIRARSGRGDSDGVQFGSQVEGHG